MTMGVDCGDICHCCPRLIVLQSKHLDRRSTPMEDKQKQPDFLNAQIAEINAAIDAIDALLDNLVKSNPEKLFDIWELDPQEAVSVAKRLGMDWFLETHAI